jgi:hypothetical protein
MPERVRLIGDPNRPIRVVEDPALVDQPDLAFFLDAWHRHKGDAPVPLRSAFAPRDYGPRLQWLVLAMALPDYADFRYRIIGSRVTRYFGADNTGRTVREVFGDIVPEMGEFICWIFGKTCKTARPVRFAGSAFAIEKMYCPDYDSLCLPYSSDGRRRDLVLQMFVFNPDRLAGSRDARRLDLE